MGWGLPSCRGASCRSNFRPKGPGGIGALDDLLRHRTPRNQGEASAMGSALRVRRWDPWHGGGNLNTEMRRQPHFDTSSTQIAATGFSRAMGQNQLSASSQPSQQLQKSQHIGRCTIREGYVAIREVPLHSQVSKRPFASGLQEFRATWEGSYEY